MGKKEKYGKYRNKSRTKSMSQLSTDGNKVPILGKHITKVGIYQAANK